jgi:hypothetical protein
VTEERTVTREAYGRLAAALPAVSMPASGGAAAKVVFSKCRAPSTKKRKP